MTDYAHDPYHHEPLDAYQEYVARKRSAEATTFATKEIPGIEGHLIAQRDIIEGQKVFANAKKRREREAAAKVVPPEKQEHPWRDQTWAIVLRGTMLALAYLTSCIPLLGWVVSIPFWIVVGFLTMGERSHRLGENYDNRLGSFKTSADRAIARPARTS